LFGQRPGAGIDALPFNGCAGGVNSAHRGVGNFGSDSVAGDEGNQVGHDSYYRVGD